MTRVGPCARLLALACLLSLAEACDGGVAFIGRQDTLGLAPPCRSPDAGASVDYCAGLPRLASAPTIDGVLECGLSLSTIDAGHWVGPGPKPSDLSVDYAAGWVDTGLYVFAHVHESQRSPAPATAGGKVYCGDATHVFADDDGRFAAPPAYDDPGTRQLVAEAPPDDTHPVSIGTIYSTGASAGGTGAWDPSRFRTFPVADGYVLEALITAPDLDLGGWSLLAGQRVGLDLSISYGGTPSEYATDPTCAKLGDFVVRTDPANGDLPHADVGAFCTPVLSPP